MNIEPIINKVKASLDAHKTPTGYSRYPHMADNEYGLADAINIMFTIDALPERNERNALSDRLKGFQSPETGLFDEGSHHPFHCTAHCIAALELLHERPLYELSALDRYNDPDAMKELLESLNWDTTDRSGHIGAGVYSALYITDKLTDKTRNAFFDWLSENNDKSTGISIKGAVAKELSPLWNHMGDWFHFLFCYSSARLPFPNPERLIDSCIRLYDEKLMHESFGRGQRFLDIDWTFTLNRASLQTGYRLDECRKRLEEFAESLTSYLIASDMSEPQWNDMHLMFGMVCALAELQLALSGRLHSRRSLRQVLDIRPFI